MDQYLFKGMPCRARRLIENAFLHLKRWRDIATPYESEVPLSLLLHLLVGPQAQHPQFLVQVVARNTQQFGRFALVVFGARQGGQDCLAFGLGTGLGE